MHTTAPSTEDGDVDTETDLTQDLLPDTMSAGIMLVAEVDSPTTTGGEEMTPAMRTLPADLLLPGLSTAMTFLRVVVQEQERQAIGMDVARSITDRILREEAPLQPDRLNLGSEDRALLLQDHRPARVSLL